MLRMDTMSSKTVLTLVTPLGHAASLGFAPLLQRKIDGDRQDIVIRVEYKQPIAIHEEPAADSSLVITVKTTAGVDDDMTVKGHLYARERVIEATQQLLRFLDLTWNIDSEASFDSEANAQA